MAMLDFLNEPVGGSSEVPASMAVPMGSEIGSPSAIADLGVMKQANSSIDWGTLLKTLMNMQGGSSALDIAKLFQGLSKPAMPTSFAAMPQKDNKLSDMNQYRAKNAGQSEGSSDASDIADILSVVSAFGGG